MVLIYCHFSDKRKCNFPNTIVKAVKENTDNYIKPFFWEQILNFHVILELRQLILFFFSKPYYLHNEVTVFISD